MADQKVGVVTHYYDKIGVAVIKLSKAGLKVGDKIKLISPDGSDFTQEVASMQIEHAKIEIAKAGDEFGLKVTKPVKPKTEIFKTK
jgi:putative protease